MDLSGADLPMPKLWHEVENLPDEITLASAPIQGYKNRQLGGC
jgi:hypothetical protein